MVAEPSAQIGVHDPAFCAWLRRAAPFVDGALAELGLAPDGPAVFGPERPPAWGSPAYAATERIPVFPRFPEVE